MSVWRRLSGIFNFSPDSNGQYRDRSASPEPKRGRSHYTSSSRTPKSPRQHYTQPHSPPAGQAAIPEDPTERSDSPEGSKFSIVARESDIGGDRETTTMPPERRNTVNRRQVAVPPEAHVGSGKTSMFRRGTAKQSTVNSHEIWMSDGSKSGGGKDTPQKDKQKEKDVYTSGNGNTGLIRNKSQELLDVFKSSTKTSKGQTIRNLTAENHSLTSQIQTLEAQLQNASEREYVAQSRVRELDEQNRTLQRKSMQDEEEIQDLVKTSTRSAEANARHIRDLEQRGQGLEEQVKKLRERVQKAETAAAHAQSRSASASTSRAPPTRRGTASSIPEVHHASAERRAEEVFQSKADAYAGAEIIRMVQALNAEILQCAAFISETVMNTDIRVVDDNRTVEKCKKRATERVGQRLVGAMRRTIEIGERDPLPMQLALQHAIIASAVFIVQAFTPENKELNGQLSGIWGKISMKEEPAVAGKWRAILAAQLKGSSSMHRAIYEECKYIMVAGGWSTKSPNSASIAVNIQARIQAIEGSILKLKEAIVEGVTSTEVVPSLLPESHPYDPADMDSAYPDPTDPDMVKKPIVCTVDMGVRRSLVLQPLAAGGRSASRSWETILKPKVILPSALDDDDD